jgi:hypothetical protein
MWYLLSKYRRTAGGREESSMGDLDTGALNKRLEAAITSPMDAAINDVAKALAGSRSPKMFRSKAARRLIMMGFAAWKREQEKAGAKA